MGRLSDPTLEADVHEAVDKMLDKANRRFPDLGLPLRVPVNFHTDGDSPVRCGSGLIMSFHAGKLERSPQRFLQEHVPHAVAHLVVAFKHGTQKMDSHGKEYKAVYKKLKGR